MGWSTAKSSRSLPSRLSEWSKNYDHWADVHGLSGLPVEYTTQYRELLPAGLSDVETGITSHPEMLLLPALIPPTFPSCQPSYTDYCQHMCND